MGAVVDQLPLPHPIAAAMVTRFLWPRALIRSKQKPVSSLWRITRSTIPAGVSTGTAVTEDVPIREGLLKKGTLPQ